MFPNPWSRVNTIRPSPLAATSIRIRTADELLVEHSVGVDPELGEPHGQRDRNTLVQFDLHGAALSGTSSSRASRAP